MLKKLNLPLPRGKHRRYFIDPGDPKLSKIDSDQSENKRDQSKSKFLYARVSSSK